MSDEDVARAIEQDPGTFEVRPEWLDHAVIVIPARPKERITARFDKDVIAWVQGTGRGLPVAHERRAESLL